MTDTERELLKSREDFRLITVRIRELLKRQRKIGTLRIK